MQTPESLSAGLILFFIQPYRAANPPLTLAFVTSYDSCLDNCSVGGPTVLNFHLMAQEEISPKGSGSGSKSGSDF